MFPRSKRLTRKAFPILLKEGKRLSSKHFTVVFSNNQEGYAIVIPKKIARLSVTRHRTKRRICAALRTLSLPPALIIFSRLSASSVSYQEVKTELANLLSKIKLP